MLQDMLLALIAFSGYLTLRDWVISGYLVIMLVNLVYSALYELGDQRQIQFLLMLINLIFYGVALLVIGKEYWNYERGGGN